MAKRVRRQLSAATKFKMSLSKQGSKNPMKGKRHSEDTKRKISRAMKEYWRNILY